MSDWQVGDLAVCVDVQARITGLSTSLVEGRVYRVVGLFQPGTPEMSDFGSPVDLALYLAGLTASCRSGAFDHRRFRKIRPDEQQACEPEFIVLLNRSKVTA